jgi:hypothetical protein
MTATATLYAAPYQAFSTRQGVKFTADANGVIANVPLSSQADLIEAGAAYVSVDVTGIQAIPLALTSAMTAAGGFLTTALQAGAHYISMTPGTGLFLLGESAVSNTKTDTSYFEVVLPSTYVTGSNLSVAVNSQLKGSGTAGTKTLSVLAYRCAANGTHGSNIETTSPQVIPSVAASLSFNINGATLNPGDRVMIGVVSTLQETGGVALQAQLNSISLA